MAKPMDAVDEDDDMPMLSGDAFTALQDFYSEKDQREKDFEELKAKLKDKEQRQSTPLSMKMFSEDWNASQFWYSDETATLLAKEILRDATADTRIVVVCVPSVFIQIKNLLASRDYGLPHVRLLEFDQRFEVFEEYVQYDFNAPLKLPVELKASFDRVLCDPPFLSEDCHTKGQIHHALDVLY